MKKLVILLALVSGTVWADCSIQQTSQMVNRHQVGEVTDLVKDKNPGQCTVRFRVKIDDTVHNIQWTHRDFYQEEVLCRMAVKHGINDRLVSLPGVYKTETVTACAEKKKPKTVYAGYEGEEADFGINQMHPKYFKTEGVSKCRIFKNYYSGSNIQEIRGTICENKNNLWTVVQVY